LRDINRAQDDLLNWTHLPIIPFREAIFYLFSLLNLLMVSMLEEIQYFSQSLNFGSMQALID